jgi:murein DD-endopeptidase MepM/ murein hydrolase activator NlpD
MTQRTATRRQLFGSAAAVVAASAGVAAAALRAGRTSAGSLGVAGAANVDEPAVRLSATTTSTTTPTTTPTGIVPIRRPTAGTLRFPIDPLPDCHLLDNFGDCRSGGTRAHLGIDIVATRGRDVYAVRPGVLRDSFDNTGTAGYGWTLAGDDAVTYRYMHLDRFAPGLLPGARVTEGQVIGYAGSTGNDTYDNVHLHFEVRIDGTWVDPLPLLIVPAQADIGAPLKGCLGLVNR